MVFFKKWFGESPDTGAALKSREPVRTSAPAKALPGTAASDGYQDETSFTWSAKEPVSSAIFDAPAGRISLVEDVQDDENAGYDPYDTGRFG